MQQKAGGMGQGWRRGVAAGLAMGLLAAAAQVVAVEAPRSDADAERFALRAELFEEYPHILPAMMSSANAGFFTREYVIGRRSNGRRMLGSRTQGGEGANQGE